MSRKMISFCVLKTEDQGFSIFLCVDMSGGEQYRNAIVHAASACTYFIILLNQEWGLSGECEDEYNLAKRKNLTSHEVA